VCFSSRWHSSSNLLLSRLQEEQGEEEDEGGGRREEEEESRSVTLFGLDLSYALCLHRGGLRVQG
jgi:hypothetical protein